jgi:drug/metabolite transporter (DMT)-like permease
VIPVLVLIAVTAVFGWTFVVVKDAVAHFAVAPFLALRFALALLVLALLIRHIPSRRALLVGLPIGAAVAAGYALQTYGLQKTAPGTAGLITGLFVVFTPLIDRAFGARIAARTWIAVLAALVGTALLAGGAAGAGLGMGDLLVFGSAICWALQIVLLARRAPDLRSVDLAITQIAVTFLVFAAAGSDSWSPPTPSVWIAVGITGILASAFAFWLQAWAQTRLSAARAALVLATEPAWALLFSIVLAGQRLDFVQVIGAVLLLAAVIGHEAAPLLAPAAARG